MIKHTICEICGSVPVAQMDRAPAFQLGAFIGKGTYEVDIANSVDILKKDYTELPPMLSCESKNGGSVETLHDGAVTLKIKSSQQAEKSVVRVI